jgi:hypothetical protein
MNIMNTDLAKEARRIAAPLGKSCDSLNISYSQTAAFIYASHDKKIINIEIYQNDNGTLRCRARSYLKTDGDPALQDRLLEVGTIGELGAIVRQYLDKRKAA